MTQKFQNRIDYVDLGAFGVSNTLEGTDHKCIHQQEEKDSRLERFFLSVEKFSGQGALSMYLKRLDRKIDELSYHVVLMCLRYD